jgi:hypothetical protein
LANPRWWSPHWRNVPAPSAENDPRLHGGRKGAYGVAPRWRAPPLPPPLRRAMWPGRGGQGKYGSERETAQPRDRYGTVRMVPPLRLLFGLVTGRFALGRLDPAQGPARQGGGDDLSRRTGPDVQSTGRNGARRRPECLLLGTFWGYPRDRCGTRECPGTPLRCRGTRLPRAPAVLAPDRQERQCGYRVVRSSR